MSSKFLPVALTAVGLITAALLVLRTDGSSPFLEGKQPLARAIAQYDAYEAPSEAYEAALASLRGKSKAPALSLVTIPNDEISQLEWLVITNYVVDQILNSKFVAIHGLRIYDQLKLGDVQKLTFAAHEKTCRSAPLQRIELCLVQGGTLARCTRVETQMAYEAICLESVE